MLNLLKSLIHTRSIYIRDPSSHELILDDDETIGMDISILKKRPMPDSFNEETTSNFESLNKFARKIEEKLVKVMMLKKRKRRTKKSQII